MKKIRVLIVDDSSIIRTLLSKILSSDAEIEVIGTAPDPFVARDKLIQLSPDVMTLDIEMPKMDGVTFLGKVMKHLPTRTLVISSLSTEGSESALRALEAGAIDVMAKPAIDIMNSFDAIAQEVIQRVKAVAKSRLIVTRKILISDTDKINNCAQAAERKLENAKSSLSRTTHQVLAIASSTGGTEALKVLLAGFPRDLPGTVIVQHMPPVFTKAYADYLQQMFPFEVKEAEDGDRILPGRVLLAPGNYHMEVSRKGAHYFVQLNQNPILNGVRPAADYLMKSVAKYVGSNAIGVVLTGMGKDGAEGLLEMRKAGSYNIAQNEDTCVVYGMPKVAVELGAIDIVLPLEEIAKRIVEKLHIRAVA